MKNIIVLVCGLAVTGWGATEDDLPRHGVIGLAVGRGDDNRPTIVRVVEGGAGAAAGFQRGDVMESVDDVATSLPEQFTRAVGRHLAGETVRIALVRSGQRMTLAAVLKPRPWETSPYAEVLYRSVAVRGARRRAIVTRPRRDGRLPAVLIIGGLGCYSLDGTDRQSGYGRVISSLEEKGFVTMRVEKTGEGDSEGPDCTDLSATPDLEAEGYVAGLRALKSYDFVDPRKVFIFAHSMGPVVGALAIGEEPVRGFIAVETVGTSWFEYDMERTRVQEALDDKLPDAVDQAVREYEPCSHRFFVEKQRPDQLLETPACRAVISPFGAVPYTYMQAVADISLGRQWKQADFPVLVIYGTASPVTTARQNEYLAEIINRYHPGRATYVEIPGMGHDLNRYESQKDYHQSAGSGGHPFHTGLLDVMLKWLDALMGEGGRG
jgi:pimeloyl-ACP methyl ester carboxylesterase